MGDYRVKLLGIEKGKRENVYVFNIQGVINKLGYTSACKIINDTNVKDRNCMIRNGAIMLKSHLGKTSEVKEKELLVILINRGKYTGNIEVASNDLYFRGNVKRNPEFLKKHSEIIKKWDKAEIVNYVTMEVRTPFGITSIDNISTGCKTLINLEFIRECRETNKDIHILLDECGSNMIWEAFRLMQGTNIIGVISYMPFLDKEDMGLKFKINGKIIDNYYDLMDAMEE